MEHFRSFRIYLRKLTGYEIHRHSKTSDQYNLLQVGKMDVEMSREQGCCHARETHDGQTQDLPEQFEGICQLWNVCNVFLGAG